MLSAYSTLLVIAAAVLASAALLVFARGWASAQAEEVVATEIRQSSRAQAQLIENELQKLRLIPVILQEYTDLQQVLSRPTQAGIAILNRKLVTLSQRTGAAVVFLIDDAGESIAASRPGVPRRFTGPDAVFGRSFARALRSGAVEFFAQGVTSRYPGHFVARRLTVNGRPAGVIVAKVEFEALERIWRDQATRFLAIGRDRRVLIAAQPEVRFRQVPQSWLQARAIRPDRLPPEEARFAGALGLLPAETYRVAPVGITLEHGTLLGIAPIGQALSAARTRAYLAAAGAVIVLLVLGGLAFRARERAQMLVNAASDLERQVRHRTEELSRANEALVAEGKRRKRADLRFREAREQLSQASRLATLGQVSAGVAHELNQPIAAMRIFSENATHFLKRGQIERVEQKLVQIMDLAARMGAITGELRAMSRRTTPTMSLVRVDAVLEGVGLLLADRLAHVDYVVAGIAASKVCGDKVRLEQILINLVQNALDALRGHPAPTVRIDVEETAGDVHISVSDNGGGVAEGIRPTLFTPFATTREEGLGLGLSIARDIAREFGGALDLTASRLGGATFTLSLERR